MTKEQFMILNPCISKVINGGKITKHDVLQQSEFLKTHTFAFNLLPENRAYILKFRYGLFDGNIYTCEQVANMYNTTRAWVSWVEHEAFKELAKDENLQMLMKYDDMSIEDRFIKHLIKDNNYKIFMCRDVRKAIFDGQIRVIENVDISNLRTNKKNANYNGTKQKLIDNGINTINELLEYLYYNKGLKKLQICQETLNSIIYGIMRLIEDKKLCFTSKEIEMRYLYDRDKYLQILKETNKLDTYLFPEHELEQLAQQQKQIEAEVIRVQQKQYCINNTNYNAQQEFVSDINTITIDNLNFSVRTYNALRRAEISTIYELIDYYYKNKAFKGIKSLGVAGVKEVETKLAELGISLTDNNVKL